jgi:hypothetical protein
LSGCSEDSGGCAERALTATNEAPRQSISPGVRLAAIEPAGARGARRIDFVRLDAENRRLGRQGQEWAREYEVLRLTDHAQRPDLAKRIIWVSEEEGDGSGCDIRSFEADGRPNEVAVSQRELARYQLYRLFRFGRGPRLDILPGAL